MTTDTLTPPTGDNLIELVESAFFEGFCEGRDGGWVEGDPTPAWKKSEVYAALTALEGETNA